MDYTVIIYALGCYFLGSVNFALIISKAKKKDIRTEGSGNPGTMNMLRHMGLGLGALTFICDALKGICAALIGLFVYNAEFALIGGCLCALGHIFPLFLKLKGGKGVAVSIGVFCVLLPAVALPLLLAFIAYLFFFRYGFLGSIFYVLTLSLSLSLLFPSPITISCCVILSLLILFTHRKNFIRWIKKEENPMRLIDKLRTKKADRTKGDGLQNSLDSEN